jgi:hypothetical protein
MCYNCFEDAKYQRKQSEQNELIEIQKENNWWHYPRK